jgi:serine/threonine-protein kinase HipA
LKAHQMSVNGKRENIKLEDLLAVAKNINLKKPKPIIELCSEVLSNWRDYATKSGVENTQIEQIGKQIILYKL